jgi:hypothetical protein
MRAFLPGLLLCVSAYAQQVIGTVEARDVTVRGAVTLSGNSAELRSGAQLTTEEHSATVSLARGGTLKICPRSSLQITSSPAGRELLIALDSGAIETDYSLSGSADAIMTSDFQLQLTGPGVFHYAIGVSQARLCTRALAGSNASVIVSESLGSGSYQIRPNEGALFQAGTVANPDTQNVACGCPEQVVKAPPPELGFPEQQSEAAAQALASGEVPPSAPPIAGVPETTEKPEETITEVSVPLAFTASEQPIPELPPPVTDANLAELPKLAMPVVQPPPKPKSTNWLKRFFKKIFR